MRARALVAALALFALWPQPGSAKPVAEIAGGTVYFYVESLSIAVRNGVTVRLSNGMVISGTSAFVDLRADKAVIAGNAEILLGTTRLRADALAFDFPARRIDVLRAGSGIARADATLTQLEPAPDDGDAFVFPDLVDKKAYIRARRAEIVSRTSVRFLPASFPTTTGAPPVPMYLYTFATANGYAASALSSAAFDQPYGLFSSPNALTVLHFRYLNGIGPALGIEQNFIGNNDGYVATAVDIPIHGAIDQAVNAYGQVGDNGTVSANATSGDGVHAALFGASQAIGVLVSKLNYAITNAGYSSAILSLRTRDSLLFSGITWHASVNFGWVAQDGGVYPLAPSPAQVQQVWQKGIEVFVASPLVKGPFRTTLSATVDGLRTDFSYPQHFNALETNFTGSRRLSRTMTAFFGYDARWAADIFPNNQLRFFPPPPAVPYVFAGYTTARLANFDLQYVQGPYTSIRLSYRHANDYPQVNYYVGRPPNEVNMAWRIRPFPNIGISFARSYDFGWNGSRWVPGWSLSIFQ